MNAAVMTLKKRMVELLREDLAYAERLEKQAIAQEKLTKKWRADAKLIRERVKQQAREQHLEL